MTRLLTEDQRTDNQNITFRDAGIIGENIAQFSNVAFITTAPPGRYRLWGHGRHSLSDGLRIVVGSTVITEIASDGGTVVYFGPVVVDIPDDSINIFVELNKATGAGQSASASLFAQKIG